jgi:MFS family permease
MQPEMTVGVLAASKPGGWGIAIGTKTTSLRALEWLNFFVADVQTGLGPFLAAYLAASGWNPARLGMLLTVGGLMPIVLQIPAGGVVDEARHKRGLLAAAIVLIAGGALLLGWRTSLPVVLSAQVVLAIAGLFVGPLLAAIALGIVGPAGFDRQLGKNQSFAAAGNVVTALLMAGVSYWIGMRDVFLCAALLAVPTLICLSRIRSGDIDERLARGAAPKTVDHNAGIVRVLLRDRVLLIFFLCASLFHLSNAAMLPELGEMLARGHARAAGSLMSACVIVTQFVISIAAAGTGRLAHRLGRRPLLLTGFAALVVRGCLYTVVRGDVALIAVQLLDGVANVIFGVVSVLVVADRTRGTGRFNLAQGALASFVGIGAALSTTYGGLLIQRFGYNASFLGLAGVGLLAFLVLLLFFPETRRD